MSTRSQTWRLRRPIDRYFPSSVWCVLIVGAGWGGAIVALTTKRNAEHIVDRLIKEYYSVKFPDMKEEEIKKSVFATQPGSGALVYVVGKKGIQ
jgi:galactokinase